MADRVLSDEQQTFVDARAPRLMCLAGGGCGKTFAVAERVAELSKQGESVLVLAFTNSAVSVISNRLAERDVPVPVQTIVSLAWELVRDEYGIDPRAISDCEDLLNEACARTPIAPSQLRLFEGAVANSAPVPRSWKTSLVKVFENYVALKRARGVLSFTDVVVASIGLSPQHYDEVIVDEAQDLTPTQWAFVQGLRCSRLTLVGDAEQSIFGFAGVDGGLLNKLSPTFEVCRLTRSFRVPAELMPVLNSARSNPLTSVKTGGSWDIVQTDSKNVLDCVANIVGDGWCVIARTNAQLERLADVLPPSVELLTAHSAKGGEWENVCVVGVGENGFETTFDVPRDEARRLFYVAVSRALKHLTLVQTGDSTPFGLVKTNE